MPSQALFAAQPPEARRIHETKGAINMTHEPNKAAAVIRNLILAAFIAIALFPVALSVTASAII
jgi:hypothetical protein